MQSIDIETRWGVPRFSQANETESYLLEGKPLSDRTYRRTEEVSRETDKRFYPMVEGNFSSSLSLFTATGMTKGSTYTLKYNTSKPADATTEWHGIYLGSSATGTTQVLSFTAQ